MFCSYRIAAIKQISNRKYLFSILSDEYLNKLRQIQIQFRNLFLLHYYKFFNINVQIPQEIFNFKAQLLFYTCELIFGKSSLYTDNPK